MISRQVIIKNKIGLHARPAAMLIHRVNDYKSSFILTKGEESTNLRSITSLMKMRVKCGDMITLAAKGEDEESALSSLVELIEGKFGEE
jgi:phosphocarrier protein